MATLTAALLVLLCSQLVLAEYPPHPYSAVWNSPTTKCFGTSLDLSHFAIMQNQGDAINGGNITVFTDIGEFPRWGTINNTIVNGGLPQLGNLSLHLSKVEDDINSLIPDPSFRGLAVIDFQVWRPLFRHNFDERGVYQQQSIAKVRTKHPDWNKTLVEMEAAKEFNEGARAFFEGTLKLARKLRPEGLWGFMGYPYCNGYLGYYCDNMSMSENDMMGWLWNASSTLYPTVFYGQNSEAAGDQVISLVSVIHESHRIMASRPSLYLYLYTRYTYFDAPEKFYSKGSIEQSTTFANLFGVDGVVVLGSTVHMTSKPLCSSLLNFINNTFGPLNKSAYDQAVECSNAQCNSHGQCVDKSEGVELLKKIKGKRRSDHETDKHLFPLLVISWDCRCYRGWKGEDCSEPSDNYGYSIASLSEV